MNSLNKAYDNAINQGLIRVDISSRQKDSKFKLQSHQTEGADVSK